jgi:hypothetical protein
VDLHTVARAAWAVDGPRIQGWRHVARPLIRRRAEPGRPAAACGNACCPVSRAKASKAGATEAGAGAGAAEAAAGAEAASVAPVAIPHQ